MLLRWNIRCTFTCVVKVKYRIKEIYVIKMKYKMHSYLCHKAKYEINKINVIKVKYKMHSYLCHKGEI